MSQINEKHRPALFKALLWGVFSLTAMMAAFILPVHLYALLRNYDLHFMSNVEHPFLKFYLFVVLFCALYHGLYRTKTIFHDLGFGNYERAISYMFYVLVILGIGLALYISFWDFFSMPL